jgi:Rha family phage regulatory protein
MNELEQKTLTSMEVAEMTGKLHKNLLADIRGYEEELNELNIQPVEFFMKSTYKDAKGQTRPCYNVTKKGCEFIAHKLTGIKGTEFTAKYINRFHEMEEVIRTQIPTGKELLALAVIEAQKTIDSLKEHNTKLVEDCERMKPKEIFADAVATSHTSILIGDLAKLICQNGYEIGQKRMFIWLRENGYLIKSGNSRNIPTQRYIEQGLFEIKESNVLNPDGSVRITRTTKVTGKGQVYFVNKFLAEK